MILKYQLTCPKCKHEFAYDNGHIDGEISRNAVAITSLMKELADFRLLPADERKRRKAWELRTRQKLAELHQKQSQLKSFRKVADQQVNEMMLKVLKDLIKEEIGEAAYKKLIEKALKEMEAYKISGLMMHEYTRANYKTSVTSINKL